MKPITYRKGDATEPYCDEEGPKIIIHVCNDIGRWGKGFVVALSRKWKLPENMYKNWHKWKKEKDSGAFKLGNVQFVEIPGTDIIVANMIGQHTIWNQNGLPPIRYSAIKKALAKVRVKSRELGATVHGPKFGAGLAGGKWELIEDIIEEELSSHDIPVYIYVL
jgi:O-acetyl-ADP-ribose deacetylase (regulator of RNase III)